VRKGSFYTLVPSTPVQAVTLQICIREVGGSDLGWDNHYPGCGIS
jgi:hypothetical protein